VRALCSPLQGVEPMQHARTTAARMHACAPQRAGNALHGTRWVRYTVCMEVAAATRLSATVASVAV